VPELIQTSPNHHNGGSFIIKCIISKKYTVYALIDLGSSINVMPTFIFEKLELGEMKSVDMNIRLADNSLRNPKGIVDNISVKIKEMEIKSEFVILDTNTDLDALIILGRPFLYNSEAMIDVPNKEITFNRGDNQVRISTVNKKISKPTPKHTNMEIEKRSKPELNIDEIIWELRKFLINEGLEIRNRYDNGKCAIYREVNLKKLRKLAKTLNKGLLKGNELSDKVDKFLNELEWGDVIEPKEIGYNPFLSTAARGDPTVFRIRFCTLQNLYGCEAFIDARATSNVIPYQTLYSEFNKKINVIWENRSIRFLNDIIITVKGFIPSIIVDIEGVQFITEFFLVEENEVTKRNIILGQPFLKTACSDINYELGELFLESGINFMKLAKTPLSEDNPYGYNTKITLIRGQGERRRIESHLDDKSDIYIRPNSRDTHPGDNAS
jgi:hypothetical protein